MTKIGTQHGATAAANRWRNLDPGGTKLVRGADGKWPPLDSLTIPLDQWGAYDKLERALKVTFADHDAAQGGSSGGGGDVDPPAPSDQLETARARIFLANHPLDCLNAPEWMVPVCTADRGYREWYGPDVIAQLRDRFGTVEAWCDCRNPTAYSEAVAMVDELGLDGPAWGQCETTAEFDHAYESGARRMVGSVNAQVLDDARLAKVAAGEVLLTVELYRNVQPWMLPDWRGANAGIGGNCIACYGSETEGAVYTPVANYRAAGLYVPKQDSVYGVGLLLQDWRDLA